MVKIGQNKQELAKSGEHGQIWSKGPKMVKTGQNKQELGQKK